MEEYKRLGKEFYIQDTLTVARELLGKRLVCFKDGVKLSGMITETEGYIGAVDKAAHSFRGMTPRNKTMWEEGGILYVYLIYGMYYCLNVVTENIGTPAAVLIRAVEPLESIDTMRFLCKNKDIKLQNLTSGPGKLCRAFGIDKTYNGIDLFNSQVYITQYRNIVNAEIAVTPRINVDYAQEAADYPWRFFIKGNSFVSRHKNNSRII